MASSESVPTRASFVRADGRFRQSANCEAGVLADGDSASCGTASARNIAAMKFYDGSKRWWIVVSVFVVIVVIIGWAGYWSIKPQRDMAAVRDYISRVQPQLLADPRFKD